MTQTSQGLAVRKKNREDTEECNPNDSKDTRAVAVKSPASKWLPVLTFYRQCCHYTVGFNDVPPSCKSLFAASLDLLIVLSNRWKIFPGKIFLK
ncbi:hypothetical protein J6590_005645 [Homalodisca vitripennis]|nr:hypothetical protein J6590_005645 [Homalodisca vitripennis]